MTRETRRIVSVFLASPGDLNEERALVEEVVQKFNKQWQRFFNLMVELVIWEDVPPQAGRPQEIINRDQLARCELFIGMLHLRWGTPTGEFSSGFEEEFSISEENYREHRQPKMSILFKSVNPELLRSPPDPLNKILEFKKSIQDRHYHRTFDSNEEFVELIEQIITHHVQQILDAESRGGQSDRFSSQRGDSGLSVQQNNEESTLYPSSMLQFLEQFTINARLTTSHDQTSAADAARMRLVALLVGSNTDESELGVHDANVLFDARDSLDLSEREKRKLLRVGLVNFENEVVPLWHWLKSSQSLDGSIVQLCSIFGNDSQRVGALNLLRVSEQSEIGTEGLDRNFFVKKWLSTSVSSAVRVAALNYLAQEGEETDLAHIADELNRADYQTKSAAIKAFVSIRAKQSSESALLALIELDPEIVTDEIADVVFHDPDQLNTETLISTLKVRSDLLRSRSVEVLGERGALSAEQLDRLSDDESAEVRLQALISRVKRGENITEDYAESKIIRKRQVQSAFGNFLSNPFSSDGELQAKDFKRFLLRNMSFEQLSAIASEANIFRQDYVFELIRREFPERGEELRVAIRDGFSDWFDTQLQNAIGIGAEPDSINQLREWENRFKLEWLRGALSVVVSSDRADDLSLVRSTLNDDSIEIEDADVVYLSHHGDWSDIDLIVAKQKEKFSKKASSLLGSMEDGLSADIIAESLCELAVGDLARLTDNTTHTGLLSSILLHSSQSDFRSLDSDRLIQLLNNENDQVRRNACLKIIITKTQTVLREIFEQYMELDAHYYNVVFLLDLGLSNRVADARRIAKKMLHSRG